MTEQDHPDIIAPPPLLYLIALLIVASMDWIQPVPILNHPAVVWAGGLVLVLGIAMNLWGARSMKRANTPINPYKPVEDIVESGAFGVSRNPLYMGLNLIFLGVILLLNSLWGILVFAALLIVMDFGVIQREERYLEARFGEAYRRYKSRVRRYL